MKRYADNGGRIFAATGNRSGSERVCPRGRRPPTGLAPAGTCRARPSPASTPRSPRGGPSPTGWWPPGRLRRAGGLARTDSTRSPASPRGGPAIDLGPAERERQQRSVDAVPDVQHAGRAAAANQCGRVVLTDVHVSLGAATVASGDAVPDRVHLAADADRQEKTLEFMFFDLSSCVQVETGTPKMPPIPMPGTAPTPPPVSTPAPPRRRRRRRRRRHRPRQA